MDIFNLDPYKQNSEFDSLSMEDQYNSIMISFKDKTRGIPLPFESIWARIVIERFGRDLLPLINNTLATEELDTEFREPVNKANTLVGQLFSRLMDYQLLTEQEIALYTVIINEKIDRYILKYRVIDTAVFQGFFVLQSLGNETPWWGNMDNISKIRDSYEQKLGITGIVIGTNRTDNVVESPLAEYITD